MTLKRSLGALLILVALPTGVALAQLAASPHDFTATGTAQAAFDTTAGGMCETCHVPHASTSTLAPLWGHTETSQSFTMYDSPTMNASDPAGPLSVSKACLSCHDGVTAVIGTQAIDDAGAMDNTNANVGLDLSGDHPISIQYAQPAADFNMHAGGQFAGSGSDSLPLYGAGNPANVECGSCHDPHDWATSGTGNAGDGKYFLREDTDAICSVCHIK